jgi:hypothetical protein
MNFGGLDLKVLAGVALTSAYFQVPKLEMAFHGFEANVIQKNIIFSHEF